MGKRELVLIVGFIVAGALVYQFTAPPPSPGERRFSLARLVENVRREIRGNRAIARATHVTRRPVTAGLREVRLRLRSQMSIIGEDRDDIQATLEVTSRAYDDAEARQTADATQLKFDDAGDALTVSLDAPQAGSQTVVLALKVPKRLAVRVDDKIGPFAASNVAAVELGSSRGRTEVTNVEGRVTVTQRGGSLTVKEVGSLKLNARGGADTNVTTVRGDVTFNLQSGEHRASGIGGAIEVESSAADLRLEKLEQARGPVRVNATSGTIELYGVGTDTRVDGRNTEIRVELDKPAPVSIYSEGNDRVEIAAPAGAGFTLDALARQGQIAEADLVTRWGLTIAGGPDALEQRVSGAVRGGGPLIMVRTNGGNIVLRERSK